MYYSEIDTVYSILKQKRPLLSERPFTYEYKHDAYFFSSFLALGAAFFFASGFFSSLTSAAGASSFFAATFFGAAFSELPLPQEHLQLQLLALLFSQLFFLLMHSWQTPL